MQEVSTSATPLLLAATWALLAVIGVSSFTSTDINRPNCRHRVLFSTSLASPPVETALWLDLRPISIHPKAAIEQIEKQLESKQFR